MNSGHSVVSGRGHSLVTGRGHSLVNGRGHSLTTGITAALIILGFIGLTFAQEGVKPTKEEKRQAETAEKNKKREAKAEEERKKYAPASIAIDATIEAIKAELLRRQLAEGYELAKEQPSQLIFKSPALGKQSNVSRAVIGTYTTRMVQTFTFSKEGERVMVFGTLTVTATNSAGVEEYPLARFGPSKELKDRMQKYLDELKQKLESKK